MAKHPRPSRPLALPSLHSSLSKGCSGNARGSSGRKSSPLPVSRSWPRKSSLPLPAPETAERDG